MVRKFVTVFLLCLLCAPLAIANVSNGDFSAGLTGWNVEYGTVTGGGVYALFEEDTVLPLPFDLSSTLSQVFTLDAGSSILSFDVEMLAVVGGDDNWAPWDAFTASLYDSGGNPLFTNPLGIDDFYYRDNTGFVDTTGTTTGNTVSLDVSSLLAGQDYLLSFDLWGGDDGYLTSVTVDNVNVSTNDVVVPVPGALLLGLVGSGMVGYWRRSRFAK